MTRSALLVLALMVGSAGPALADTFQVGDVTVDPCEPYRDACVLTYAAFEALRGDIQNNQDLAEALLGNATNPAWALERAEETTQAVVANLPQGPPDPQVPTVTVEQGPVAPALETPRVPLLLVDVSLAWVTVPDFAPLIDEAQAGALVAMDPARAAAADAGALLPDVPSQVAGPVVELAGQLGTYILPAVNAAPSRPAAASTPAPLPVAEGSGDAGAVPGLQGLLPGHIAVLPDDARALVAPTAPAALGGPGAAPPSGVEPAWPGFALLLEPITVAAVAFLGILLLVPPLYHRLQKQRLLEHGARARLFQLVGERPGIHIEELARAAGLSRSTAVYHLRLMVRHGLLSAMGGSKSVHYYPNDAGHDPALRERRALLTSPRTRLVAACVLAQPGISRTQLAAASGITVSTLSWHLGRLLQLGLVEDRLLPAGQRALHPAPGLGELLAPWFEGGSAPPAQAPAPDPGLAAAAMAFAALPPA